MIKTRSLLRLLLVVSLHAIILYNLIIAVIEVDRLHLFSKRKMANDRLKLDLYSSAVRNRVPIRT